MAPAKKKKKPAGNPARGFATVSLPSKAKTEAASKQDEIGDDEKSQNGESAIDIPDGDQKLEKSTEISAMTPEDLERHLENAELQGIIEANSSSSQKDAVRQVMRLETERRTLRLHANKLSTTSWLPEESVTELLESLQEEKRQVIARGASSTIPKAEGDLTVKVWTLRRLLVSLGLPRTDEALSHVLRLAQADAVVGEKDYLWGLPDCFQFYALNAEDLKLPSYEIVDVRPVVDSRSPSISRPASPEPVELLDTTTDQEDARVNNSDAGGLSSDSDEVSNSDGDNDPPMLISKWLAVRRHMLRNEHLKTGKQHTSRVKTNVLKLQNRLKKIESDLLFDKGTAEATWREQIPEIFAEIQAEKAQKQPVQQNSEIIPGLQGPDYNEVDADEATSHSFRPLAKSEVKGVTGIEHENEHEEIDVIFGDMFAAPETYKPSQTSLQPISGSDIRLVDFGKWSGLNPRRVLEETCKIRDKKSRLQLSLVTSTSYSNRHRLSVHWTTPQTYDPWLSSLPQTLRTKFSPLTVEIEMQGIATSTAAQSEAYISTVALFALCLTTPSQQKMSLRMPPVWRDVWQELSQTRKAAVESAERDEIRNIKKLIEEVANESGQTEPGRSISIPTEGQNGKVAETQPNTVLESNSDTEMVQREWRMKTSAQNFQRMQQQRAQLPIYEYRQQIVDCVRANPIIIISAETGAGKSTQVPSFLLEQNLGSGKDCRILVTQPRRISAITLARRVSQELGESPNDIGTRRSLVGYSIRLESKVSSSTRLTFATTGVLLRMIETSPDLEDLDYLLLDEVHERTMDLDLLFIAVKHLINRRRGIKIVLMSATVDSTKFSKYFGNAPILQIPGRTFPVEIGYLEDALLAVGKYENHGNFPQELTEDDLLDQEDGTKSGKTIDISKHIQASVAEFDEYRIDYGLIVKLMTAIATKPQYINYSKAILIFMPGIAEIRRLNNALLEERTFQNDWVIHMLHSTFSTEDLERAFMLPPLGVRKIVISTNIAETGVTIPDVTAVIDTCKEKIMRFDDRRQMSKLTEGFISRASSRQRRGRAARVQPGLCFHLVSKVRYETLMLEQSVPEMLRLSLQDAILRIKIWNLGAIEETLKQAIDPPTPKNIRKAIEALKDAGALTTGEHLTPLGRQVARLPLDVSLSKLAILGIALRSFDAAISIVAILSSKSPFLVSPYQSSQDSASTAKATFARGDSDLLTIYAAYLAWQNSSMNGSVQMFCRKHSLSTHVLGQIEDQKIQLLVQIVDAGLLSLTEGEKSDLRSARTGNSYTRKSFFIIPDRFNTSGDLDASTSSIIAAAFYPKLLIRQGNGWRNVSSNQMTSIAPNSINNSKLNPKPSKWLSFYEAMQTRAGHTNAIETSAVPEAAIAVLLGDAVFSIYAGVINIDNGRVSFSVREWKTLIALKILRGKIKAILNSFYRNPAKALSEDDEKWLEMWFKIMHAVDKQNEMAKARLLTSAHHAPASRPSPAPVKNGKPEPATRGLEARPKDPNNTNSSKQP